MMCFPWLLVACCCLGLHGIVMSTMMSDVRHGSWALVMMCVCGGGREEDLAKMAGRRLWPYWRSYYFCEN
jgi:hypothetical protein